MASRECIALSRTAVGQAEENLRIVTVRYQNGNATPTDIVDSEAALTRAQQRYYQSTFTYLAALARIDYVTGQNQTTLPASAVATLRKNCPSGFRSKLIRLERPAGRCVCPTWISCRRLDSSQWIHRHNKLLVTMNNSSA